MAEMTEAEKQIVEYHRQSIKTGNVGKGPGGEPITVYSVGIRLPEGKNAGKFVNVPGWVNGQVIENEDELYEIWKKEIDKGKWPMYDTGDELNRRAREIHKIMDSEVQEAVTAREGAKLLMRTPNPGTERMK